MPKTRVYTSCLAIAGVTFVCQMALATQLELNAGLTQTYTDNADLVPINEESDLINVPRFGLAYSRELPKSDTNIRLQVYREIYRDEEQEDETFPSLNATVNWRIVPERFTWGLADFASQDEINVQNAPTTDNTQNINVFITGPDLSFRAGGSSTMELGARFTDSRFEITGEDSTRVRGILRWLYSPSPQTTLSVNYSASSIEFKNPIIFDYDRQELFFEARTQRARSDLVFDIGATVIDREFTSDDPELLYRLTWNRQIAPRSTFTLTLADIVLDSTSSIVLQKTSDLAPERNAANNTDLFQRQSVDLSYTKRGRRTTMTAGLFARNQDYDITADDESNRGARFNIDRRVTPKLTALLFTSYAKTKFLDLDPTRVDRDTELGLNLSYRIGRLFVFNAGIAWRDRESTNATQEYTETRAILGITYARTSLLSPAVGLPQREGLLGAR